MNRIIWHDGILSVLWHRVSVNKVLVCLCVMKGVVQSQGEEHVNRFQDLFLSAQWGLLHFGLCTQVIRSSLWLLSCPFGWGFLAEPGPCRALGSAVRTERTCKSLTLDLKFDCLFFHHFCLKFGRGAVLVFWLLPLCHPICPSFISAWNCLKPKVCEIKTSWLPLLPALRWWWLSLKW